MNPSVPDGTDGFPRPGFFYERHLGLTNHDTGVVLMNQSKCKLNDHLETAPNKSTTRDYKHCQANPSESFRCEECEIGAKTVASN